jgi:hypothetical protein
MVRDGRLHLIDSAFGELRPSPWRQAVDLGNMMLVLALRTSPERVYGRARQQFSMAEITEAFAATRGLTMPSQLRRMMREQGRDCTPSSSPCCPSGRIRSGSSGGRCAGWRRSSGSWPPPCR